MKTTLKKTMGRLDCLRSLRTESAEQYKRWRLGQLTDDGLRAFTYFSREHRELLLAEENRSTRLEIVTEERKPPIDYSELTDEELATVYRNQVTLVGLPN